MGIKYIFLYCQPCDRSAVSGLLKEIHGRNIKICWCSTRVKGAKRLMELVRRHDPERTFVYVTASWSARMAAMKANLPFGFIDHSLINGVEIWHAQYCRFKRVWPQPEPVPETAALVRTEAAEVNLVLAELEPALA